MCGAGRPANDSLKWLSQSSTTSRRIRITVLLLLRFSRYIVQPHIDGPGPNVMAMWTGIVVDPSVSVHNSGLKLRASHLMTRVD